MLKLFVCAGIISLLAACSNLPGTSVSRSSRMPDTATMGGPAGNDGFGPGGYWDQKPDN